MPASAVQWERKCSIFKYLVIIVWKFIVNIFFTFVIAVGDIPGYITESGRKLHPETLQLRQ